MRCFVAIELPTAIRDRLADLQARLQVLDRAIRWTRPEHIHLTLKFLGEVPDAIVADACKATIATAAGLPPVRLEVRGVGCFPPSGSARIVWAGISGPPTELISCHRACEEVFEELGFPREDRDFRPHLTIGRSRDSRGAREVRAAIGELKDCAVGSFTASELVVFESMLSSSGPTYTALARARFGAHSAS